MAYTQRDRSTTGEQSVQGEKRVGRPRGAPSTIVNVRVPLDLVAQLDRYCDWIETHTGKTVNRGMITRRALREFFEQHAPDIL